MQIRIRYQRRGEAAPVELELSPEEYFDPLDPDETLSVESIPRLLDPYQYTPYQADELAWTVVDITDGDDFWKVRTQLLDGMRSFMHHRQSSDGGEEIIHGVEFSPGCYYTTRTLKQPGREWAVVVSCLDVDHQGKQGRDFRHQTFEEALAFGDVR